MTFVETLQVNSNSVMDHSFLETKSIFGLKIKINQKIKSDGSHGGKWIKGKLVSVDSSMVGVDLGTRIVKVSISKIRKDHNPIEDVEVPLDPAALASADSMANNVCTSSSKTSCRAEDFANTIMQHDASLAGPEGIQYGKYAREPISKGKIDILEMFSGSAKLNQIAAMQGLRAGANRFENSLRLVTTCLQPKAGEKPWKS